MSVVLLDYEKHDIKMHCSTKIEAQKRLRACAKEPETVAFIEAMPYQSCFVDVGANTGAYSLIAAKLGHWVLAFEPSKPNFNRLMENIELNEEEKIFASPVALWWRQEKLYLKLSSTQIGAAEHHLHKGAGDLAHPLDEVLTDLPQPTHMKVDVDGPELEVLLGAQQTLEGIQALQVELNDDLPSSLIIPEFLSARGFKVKQDTRHGDTSIRNTWFTR